MIPAEAVEAALWIVSIVAATSIQRWWHWKREAYRTRDAAFKGFESIKNAALGRPTP